MSVEQIEALAETRMDALDRSLMKSTLTQTKYDEEVQKLNQWVKRQYAREV